MRRLRPLLLALALLAALGLGFFLRPRPLLVVALDRAFEATRPGLVAELERPRLLGNRLLLLELPVEGAAPELLRELAERKLSPRALAASPLVARTLVEGAARNGAELPAPLIALEWVPPPGQAPRGLLSLRSDPRPGARRLGGLLASLLLDLRRGSKNLGPASPSAQAAFVWEGGPGADEGEKEAFLQSWTAKAGEGPLELDLDPGAPTADADLRSLFSADIRLLFVEAGDLAPAVLDLAEGKVSLTAVGTQAPRELAAAWPFVALSLAPDEAAFASLLRDPGILGREGERLLPSRLALVARSPELRLFDLAERLGRERP